MDIIVVGYFCLMNLVIGMYLGAFGLHGLAHPKNSVIIPILLAVGGGFLLQYAQNTFGFVVQTSQIAISITFLLLGLFLPRLFVSK